MGPGSSDQRGLPSATESPSDKTAQLARSILEEMAFLFQSIWMSSKRYDIGAKQEDLVLFEDKDMRPVFPGLHGRVGAVARQRQNQTSLVKTAA
ncbi:hypothetical protein BKA56DRAFT_719193 [Ilyonectria sp. MPI-CAGE-AT-0026]|nr:hypothetical protein BKA56DRAFT_719193 [Ilyonectria sp. MPI-CAGE-AT-0026]